MEIEETDMEVFAENSSTDIATRDSRSGDRDLIVRQLESADRTRWAPSAFQPPSDDTGRWLINLEELPFAVPMASERQAGSSTCSERLGGFGEYDFSNDKRENNTGVCQKKPGSSTKTGSRKIGETPTISGRNEETYETFGTHVRLGPESTSCLA